MKSVKLFPRHQENDSWTQSLILQEILVPPNCPGPHGDNYIGVKLGKMNSLRRAKQLLPKPFKSNLSSLMDMKDYDANLVNDLYKEVQKFPFIPEFEGGTTVDTSFKEILDKATRDGNRFAANFIGLLRKNGTLPYEAITQEEVHVLGLALKLGSVIAHGGFLDSIGIQLESKLVHGGETTYPLIKQVMDYIVEHPPPLATRAYERLYSKLSWLLAFRGSEEDMKKYLDIKKDLAERKQNRLDNWKFFRIALDDWDTLIKGRCDTWAIEHPKDRYRRDSRGPLKRALRKLFGQN